jgi:uncharacterized membrane protein
MVSSLLLLIIGVVFKQFPPKKINSFYGYRTNASKKNNKTWKFANNYSAMWMVRFALMLCLLAMVVWGFTYSFATTELIMIPFLFIALVATVIRTEMALVKYADKIESGQA